MTLSASTPNSSVPYPAPRKLRNNGYSNLTSLSLHIIDQTLPEAITASPAISSNIVSSTIRASTTSTIQISMTNIMPNISFAARS